MALFTKFTESLEDPKHPLLGPSLWILNKAGMWKSNKILNKSTIIQIFALLSHISLYIELWNLRTDLVRAMKNLSMTTLSFTCVVKSWSFVLWQDDWKQIIRYVSNLEKEQILKNDATTKTIMKEYTEYSRNIMYFYWCLSCGTVVVVMMAPLVVYASSTEYRELIKNGSVPYPELLSIWVPFDKSRGFGYVFSVLLQIITLVYGGFTVAGYDSSVVVLMTFFAGQLQILKENCKRLFDGNAVDEQDLAYRIRACHRHHVDLINYSKKFDGVLSPVLFLYIIICSFMICTSVIQITGEGMTTMQQLWIAEYVVALITQLFLYCWHSHRVYAMSVTVRDGVYISSWWSQGVRMRRNILLLSGQLAEPIALSAGPFTKLNIATFVTIIKGSYSFYTLLNQK